MSYSDLMTLRVKVKLIGADSIPVVQSERGVAGLLDFGHHQTGAQGVRHSGGDEDAVARGGREAMHAQLARSSL